MLAADSSEFPLNIIPKPTFKSRLNSKKCPSKILKHPPKPHESPQKILNIPSRNTSQPKKSRRPRPMLARRKAGVMEMGP